MVINNFDTLRKRLWASFIRLLYFLLLSFKKLSVFKLWWSLNNTALIRILIAGSLFYSFDIIDCAIICFSHLFLFLHASTSRVRSLSLSLQISSHPWSYYCRAFPCRMWNWICLHLFSSTYVLWLAVRYIHVMNSDVLHCDILIYDSLRYVICAIRLICVTILSWLFRRYRSFWLNRDFSRRYSLILRPLPLLSILTISWAWFADLWIFLIS